MPRKRFYQITRDDRNLIFEWVCQSLSATDIAQRLGKDATSISRELKRHRSLEAPTVRTRKNLCLHYRDCDRHNLCNDSCVATYPCARCSEKRCKRYCSDFEKEVCIKVRRFPYVCCGCPTETKRFCTLEKYSYSPSVADALASKLRRQSREGITLSDGELAALDAAISPLIKDSKQSVEAALRAAGNFTVSASTVRRYIDAGGLGALRIHLLSAPKRKSPRKRAEKKSSHTEDGRSYADFLSLDTSIKRQAFEADTVIGAKSDRQRFFTFVSREVSLLGIHIIPDGFAASVVAALDAIELSLDAAGLAFSDIFPSLLVDNGSEFSDAQGMERSVLNRELKRCRIFYCDPYSSWQKPKIEGIHTLIRRVLAKGVSFDSLDQTDACLLASHINSYLRADGSCPYQRAEKRFGSGLLDCLGIEKISPKKVRLKPDLL